MSKSEHTSGNVSPEVTVAAENRDQQLAAQSAQGTVPGMDDDSLALACEPDPSNAAVQAVEQRPIKELRTLAMAWTDDEFEQLFAAVFPADRMDRFVRQNTVTRIRHSGE